MGTRRADGTSRMSTPTLEPTNQGDVQMALTDKARGGAKDAADRADEGREEATEAAKERLEAAGDATDQAEQTAGDAVQAAVDTVKDKAKDGTSGVVKLVA